MHSLTLSALFTPLVVATFSFDSLNCAFHGMKEGSFSCSKVEDVQVEVALQLSC